MAKKKTKKSVKTLVHQEETRYNIPTAEMEPVRSPIRVPEGNAKTGFYQHEAKWTKRMILGGRVQCLYLDPRYGAAGVRGPAANRSDLLV